MRWPCLQFNVLPLAESYRRLSAETRGKPLSTPPRRPRRILENNTQQNATPPIPSRLEVGVRQRLGGVSRVPQASNPEPYEPSSLVVVVHQGRGPLTLVRKFSCFHSPTTVDDVQFAAVRAAWHDLRKPRK